MDYHIGVDPGLTGAFVLLDDDLAVQAVATWRKLAPTKGRKGCEAFKVATWSVWLPLCWYTETHYATSIDELIDAQEVRSATVCVEGLYERKSRLRTAEEVGAVHQVLRHVAWNPLHPKGGFRPHADTWRRTIGAAGARKKSAKAAAMAFAARVSPEIPQELLDIDHVCEALCIARYGAHKARRMKKP